MASYSNNMTLTPEAMAEFLRGVADLMEAGRVHMNAMQLTHEMSVDALMRTVINLEMIAFEYLDDPREHPAIKSQPRLASTNLPNLLTGEF